MMTVDSIMLARGPLVKIVKIVKIVKNRAGLFLEGFDGYNGLNEVAGHLFQSEPLCRYPDKAVLLCNIFD